MKRLVTVLVPLLAFSSASSPAGVSSGGDRPPGTRTAATAARQQESEAAARPRWAGVRAGEPTGRLTLHVTPQTTVVVDGDAVGMTPLGGAIRLVPGRHVVKLSHPDFDPVTRDVEIVADRETTLEVDLAGVQARTPDPTPPVAPADGPSGTLRLYVSPWATVVVDGEAVGTTPLKALTLAPGSHVVHLRHPDYRPLTRTVEVVAGEETKLEVDMAAAGEAEPEPEEAEPVSAHRGELDGYRRACDAGDKASCLALAGAYWAGRGVKEDPDRAVALFRSACERGSAHGCLRLGLAYQQGRGAPKDEGRAAALFKTACDQGKAYGCALLASAYWLGRGVPPDHERAIRYFDKACAGGVRSACEEP